MNKYGLATAIMQVCDENERLSRENEELKRRLPHEGGRSELEQQAFEIGAKAIVQKAISYFHSVNVIAGAPETFGEWTDRVLINVPSCISKDGFVTAFQKQLLDVYDAGRKGALGGDE